MNPTSQTQKKRRRSLGWYLVSGLLTLVSLAILGRLLYNNLDTLKQASAQARLWPILLTFPIFCLGEAAASYAWGRVMNDITSPLPLTEHSKVFITTHAGRRLPGTLLYVVGRIVWYARLGISKAAVSLASALEALLVVWSGMILAIGLILFLPVDTQRQLPLLALGLVLSAALMHPRLLGFLLRRMGQPEQAQAIGGRKILGWLALYLPLWLVGGTILYLVVTALYPIPLSLWPLCLGAWSLAGVIGTLIVILPSGLGVNEAALSLILATHVPPAIAVTAAIVMRILLTGYEFLFAVIVFNLYGRDGLGPKPGQQPDLEQK